MKQISFFALRGDILPVLEDFESTLIVKYVRAGGQLLTDNVETFLRGEDIPDLGIANAASAINCETFLVCERNLPINVNSMLVAAGKRFFIDQSANPDTACFTPAGVWKEGIILHSRMATVSNSNASQQIMRMFSSSIKRHFTKIKAFYVGPQAMKLLQSGKRLTIAEQASREFDLTLG